MPAVSDLFHPVHLGTLQLENRLAVAPMTRTSANPDGTVGALMQDYYTAFARGGFGLLITEGTYTDRMFSQGYRNQPGIATPAQAESWRPVVESVHKAGGRIVLQLMHAGALAQFNPYRSETVGPSTLQPRGEQMSFYQGSGPYRATREITATEIGAVIATFAAAAQRARDVGFDGVEIHGANGYLLDQFLTSYTNVRTDRYGGSTAERIRLTCEVAQAVRDATGPGFIVGVRISQAKVNDFTHKWADAAADAEIVFSSLGRVGIDYLHTTEFQANAPAFGSGPSLAALAKRYSRRAVIANGSLHEPQAAQQLLQQGAADVIALGRGALANPDWPARLRAGSSLRDFDPAIFNPLATIANAQAVLAARLEQQAEAGAV